MNKMMVPDNLQRFLGRIIIVSYLILINEDQNYTFKKWLKSDTMEMNAFFFISDTK